jgi:hypothetical protein
VTIVVHLVNLRRFTVSHAKERRDTSVRTDRDARIDRLDVARLGKDLELYDSLGHRFTVRASTRRTRPAFRVKLEHGTAPLKQNVSQRSRDRLSRTPPPAYH